jgi:hypothetical protein
LIFQLVKDEYKKIGKRHYYNNICDRVKFTIYRETIMIWINRLRRFLIIIISLILVFWLSYLIYHRFYKNSCEFNITEATDVWFFIMQLAIFLPIIIDLYYRIKKYNSAIISYSVLIPTSLVLLIFGFIFVFVFNPEYEYYQSCTDIKATEKIRFACIIILIYLLIFPFFSTLLNILERKIQQLSFADKLSSQTSID